jgi:hypothetical protein
VVASVLTRWGEATGSATANTVGTRNDSADRTATRLATQRSADTRYICTVGKRAIPINACAVQGTGERVCGGRKQMALYYERDSGGGPNESTE